MRFNLSVPVYFIAGRDVDSLDRGFVCANCELLVAPDIWECDEVEQIANEKDHNPAA